MPLSASDYLNAADTMNDMAMKANTPERGSLYLATAQVNALQAVAAALMELAAVAENQHADGGGA